MTDPLEIVETRDASTERVFGVSGFPQMLLRVGWAPVNAEPLPATPRRPLHRTSLNMWTEQLSINLLSARRLAVLSITYFGCDFGQIDVKMLDAVARLVEARP